MNIPSLAGHFPRARGSTQSRLIVARPSSHMAPPWTPCSPRSGQGAPKTERWRLKKCSTSRIASRASRDSCARVEREWRATERARGAVLNAVGLTGREEDRSPGAPHRAELYGRVGRPGPNRAEGAVPSLGNVLVTLKAVSSSFAVKTRIAVATATTRVVCPGLPLAGENLVKRPGLPVPACVSARRAPESDGLEFHAGCARPNPLRLVV